MAQPAAIGLRAAIPLVQFALLAIVFFSGQTRAAMFTVTSRADTGSGTLRQAILDANNTPGPDVIQFNIGGSAPYNIFPATQLPAVVDTVLLDATTQPGYAGAPVVGVVGSSAPGGTHGILVQSSHCEIRGVGVNRFRGDGIRIEGGSSNVVRACYIGISLTGANAVGNSIAGVALIHSSHNLIGGTGTADANVISANQIGLYITGSTATGNRVEGNLIGTNPAGNNDVGNTSNGILLFDTSGNVIGGTNAAARNVISGNRQSGVYLLNATTTGNTIAGNYIGTSISGSVAVSNRTDGITLYNASGNLIGGSTPGAGNVISGNHERGVFIVGPEANDNRIQGNLIGTSASGTSDLGNRFTGVGISAGSRNVIGGTNQWAKNIISGNNQSGIAISEPTAGQNVVLGNWIGIDISGTNVVANSVHGITVSQGTNNIIGGIMSGAGNTIAGNSQNGIFIAGGSRAFVQGNLIGTDASGHHDRGNGQAGVRIESTGNTIGGDQPAARNVVSANNGSGVLLIGAGSSNNVIAGNWIGTDITGLRAIGNSLSGVNITNASRNLIGGATALAGNTIAANGSSGISISGTATGNRISRNFVGTDITGQAALPNNGGLYLFGAGTTLIGGPEPGAGNVISGNAKVGISIGDPGATNNVLQGNWIGLARWGSAPLGNEWHGVEFLNSASNNLVGGESPSAANRIGHAQIAGYDGVRVRDGCIGNRIIRNSIVNNGGLAIDLGAEGVTANDPGDGDVGANALQNFPVLLSATGRYAAAISGSLNSRPNSTYRLDFYGNINRDNIGHGEGDRWLGTATVTTGTDGNVPFALTLTNLFDAGGWLSATATDADGNTSEFSLSITNVPAPDTDGDGLPDDYEDAFGLIRTSALDRDSDRDLDGASNISEFAAGTNPRDPGSAFRLELHFAGDVARLSFHAMPGRTYTVDGASTVNGPWEPLASGITGHGSTVHVEAREMGGLKFFRARKE